MTIQGKFCKRLVAVDVNTREELVSITDQNSTHKDGVEIQLEIYNGENSGLYCLEEALRSFLKHAAEKATDEEMKILPSVAQLLRTITS